MEALTPCKTLSPDPLPAQSSDLEVQTLAQTENNAASDTPFATGDFVWARVKGPLWWPAVVSPEMKKDAFLVSYFGDYDTYAWCEPKQLKHFVEVFEEMSRQSSSTSFLRAFNSCMGEIEKTLELEMTCHCVPVEAWPKPIQEDGSWEVPVTNLSSREFMDWIMDAATDVFSVNSLEIVQLKIWVVCFGKVLMQEESWEFHRRRVIDDLVDKIDLDALPVEMVGGKEEEEEGLVATMSKGSRITKLILEKDLDILRADDDNDDDEEEDEEEEEQSLNLKKNKSMLKFDAVKAEEEFGSTPGRRERKKSKYLSPPYTNMREVGKFLATLPKNSEEKTPRKVVSITDQSGEEDENKSYLSKIERIPTPEFLSEIVSTAQNSLHLKGNRAAKVIRHFFAIYRKSKYSGGADSEEYRKLVPECMAKTEDATPNAAKLEIIERKNKDGVSKESDFSFKQRKSNRKHGVDQETKLVSEDRKRSRKIEVDQGVDVDSKQQKSASLEKQRPRREKISKFGTVADTLDEGKEKQKTRRHKSGASHGNPVDSDEGREKRVLKRGKKISNDETSKGAPFFLDLDVEDASGEQKTGHGRKRRKNDANGEAAVNLILQSASHLNERGSLRRGRAENTVNLTAKPMNSQKPVLRKETKMGSKEDANGRSIKNSGNSKLSGGKPSPKKKSGTSSSSKSKLGRRKAKNDDHIQARQAALQLTFHSGILLPSIEDLITSYSKYGALIDSEIELFEESNSARVVFANAEDAENAVKDKAGPFGSIATYRLHYLPENLDSSQPNHDVDSVSLQISDAMSPSQQTPDLKSSVRKPPLPYIRKSLETMISTLAWCSSPVNNAGSSSDGLKPEARDNLVGEMQGLLQKVDRMLNGASGSSSST